MAAAVFVEETLVHLARTQIVIDDLDRRMQALEIPDQRLDHLPVGRGVEHHGSGLHGSRDEQAGEARRPTQIVQDAPPDLLFFHLFDCTAGAAGAADRETTPMHAHAPAAD